MSSQFDLPIRKALPTSVARTIYGIISGWRRVYVSSALAFCLSSAVTAQGVDVSEQLAPTSPVELARYLAVGDVVFIRVSALPFKKVASATQSWTNHVGVVISVSGAEPLIGESTFPFSRATPLSRFVARSESSRIEVRRLNVPLSTQQQVAIFQAAQKRMGIFYDTGFSLKSKREFCSRYVREVLSEATGIEIGEVENFSALLTRNPKVDLVFWRVWFFGNIPWQRETVTPASLLQSSNLHSVFVGDLNTKAHSESVHEAQVTL